DYRSIKLGKYTEHLIAKRSGKLKAINNIILASVARSAGAPLDKGAGVLLHKHVGDKIQKGEKLMSIYAESKYKLSIALKLLNEKLPLVY
ncbi:thymidine phosphorylase, partial [Candidatus Woesearchaeota archaeon]